MEGLSLRQRLERRRHAASVGASSSQPRVSTSAVLEHTSVDEKCIRAYWNFVVADELPKKHRSLAELKRFARLSNFEAGWQKISGKEHTKQLRDQLLTVRDSLHKARNRVLSSRGEAKKQLDSAIRKAFEGRRNRGKKRKRAGEDADVRNDFETARTQVQKASHSVFHFVPSGCGTIVVTARGTRLLTCAHCVDHDDDGEEEEQEGEGKSSGSGSGSSTSSSSSSSNGTHSEIKRVGRLKFFLWDDGSIGLAVCTASSEKMDVALLRIVASEKEWGDDADDDDDDDDSDCVLVEGEGSSAAGAAAKAAAGGGGGGEEEQEFLIPPGMRATIAPAAPTPGTPVVCIHNPYFVDLETKFDEDAEEWEKDTGFLPFSADAGKITGFRGGDRRDATRFGATKHSCWT